MMDTFNKQTVTQIFEQQVFYTPEGIAVYDQFTALTYQQLNEKANQLAHWLHHEGIIPGDFVALLLEPSVEFIICILAIIKARAVYLPLDVLAPSARLREILNDAVPRIFIKDEKYFVSEIEKCIIYSIKDLHTIIENFPTQNLISHSVPQEPIYMMYTSGSTGVPKGVIIPHCAVVNLTKTVNYGNIHNSVVLAQFSNTAFDASTFEIWGTLLNGATLAIVPLSVKQNYLQLKTFLFERKVEYLFLSTAYFQQLVRMVPDVLDSITTLIFGGEQVNPNVISKFIDYRESKNLPLILIHAYGPTEATVFSSQNIINDNTIIDNNSISNIGKPIQNVRFYVLNERMECVNSGQEGELYISGINLALGYQNNKNLDNEKFIANPFDNQYPFQQLYKTGDLVKQLCDGSLLWLGRIDDQVKIQGFRVHLSEIEKQLLLHPLVSAATVVIEKDEVDRARLIAYVVFFNEEKSITSNQIREYLAAQLPSYMLPTKYIEIDQMPLTTVGKIDKKRLSKVPGIDLASVKILPSNTIEKKLTAIFIKLLNVNRIDVTQNLFDLGMNSLLLVEVCCKISQEFQWPFPLEAIITYPSIQKLSDYMQIEMCVDNPETSK